MAIWDCSEEENGLAHLLEMALPDVSTQASMVKNSPEDLRKITTYADSMTDCLISQQAALADLIANADHADLKKYTMQNAGWLLESLTHMHELVRGISGLANICSDPESRDFYERLGRKQPA